jgi:hypothetical protein
MHNKYDNGGQLEMKTCIHMQNIDPIGDKKYFKETFTEACPANYHL